MKPIRNRLDAATRSAGVTLDVVQKDYALSYMLAGIASQPALADALVFKGGTALKKCLFGDYRFSEDLDFSARSAPRGADLEAALLRAKEEASRMLLAHGPFSVDMKRAPHRGPHPHGQEDFNVFVKFPWHGTAGTKIKVEVSHDEPVILEPEIRPLIHGYEETLSCKLSCYHVEEIVAEKLRSLRQTDKKLEERGWNKPRARDYYDLWRVLGKFGGDIQKKTLLEVLQKKCAHRRVAFARLDDFFTERLVSEAKANWERNLGSFVKKLPQCDAVLTELRSMIPRYLPGLE